MIIGESQAPVPPGAHAYVHKQTPVDCAKPRFRRGVRIHDERDIDPSGPDVHVDIPHESDVKKTEFSTSGSPIDAELHGRVAGAIT